MNHIEILPTNTCPPDLQELERRSEEFARFTNFVHLDIDDGKFAPALSWPYGSSQWSELEQLTELPESLKVRYEAHLMVQQPREIGALLAKAGCKRIIAHVEALGDTDTALETFSTWLAAGATEIGVALLIDTRLSTMHNLAPHCDEILLMSIATLGSQGAAFDTRIFPRIEQAHQLYPQLTIAVDGGVNGNNIRQLVQMGARRFGVGSAIAKAEDPGGAYRDLLSLAEETLRESTIQ
jgi:ribulose-phosphate 3-epimerase